MQQRTRTTKTTTTYIVLILRGQFSRFCGPDIKRSFLCETNPMKMILVNSLLFCFIRTQGLSLLISANALWLNLTGVMVSYLQGLFSYHFVSSEIRIWHQICGICLCFEGVCTELYHSELTAKFCWIKFCVSRYTYDTVEVTPTVHHICAIRVCTAVCIEVRVVFPFSWITLQKNFLLWITTKSTRKTKSVNLKKTNKQTDRQTIAKQNPN